MAFSLCMLKERERETKQALESFLLLIRTPILPTSFNFNYLLKGPICKYSHIGQNMSKYEYSEKDMIWSTTMAYTVFQRSRLKEDLPSRLKEDPPPSSQVSLSVNIQQQQGKRKSFVHSKVRGQGHASLLQRSH